MSITLSSKEPGKALCVKESNQDRKSRRAVFVILENNHKTRKKGGGKGREGKNSIVVTFSVTVTKNLDKTI